jgi:hypothetical protein
MFDKYSVKILPQSRKDRAIQAFGYDCAGCVFAPAGFSPAFFHNLAVAATVIKKKKTITMIAFHSMSTL